MDAETPVGDRTSINGGLSQSRYFCQMLANATGRTLAAAAFSELTGEGLSQLVAGGLIDIVLDEPVLTTTAKGTADLRPALTPRWRSLGWR